MDIVLSGDTNVIRDAKLLSDPNMVALCSEGNTIQVHKYDPSKKQASLLEEQAKLLADLDDY
jgi:hypothetical protein